MEEGHCPSQGAAARIARDQERAQAGRGLASCSRLARAAFKGSLSAILEAVGSAVVRSIEKVVCPRPRNDSFSRVFDQAMVTRAPWRSYSPCSSPEGASGLCSTTMAPSRSAP